MDTTDLLILDVLLDNSRLSYRQIAKKMGKSVATVMNRIKQLEKEGIIKGYSARLNYDALGYDIPIIVEVSISKGKLFEVEKKIGTHKNVSAVYDVIGTSDAIIIARFRNRAMMDRFLKKIQSYDFVERTETKLILNVLKEEVNKL